jgi:hypothetical protein
LSEDEHSTIVKTGLRSLLETIGSDNPNFNEETLEVTYDECANHKELFVVSGEQGKEEL